MSDAKVSAAEPVKLTRTQRLIAEAGSKKKAPEKRIKIKPTKKPIIGHVELPPIDEADDTLDQISRKAQETLGSQSLGRQANEIVKRVKTGRPSSYTKEIANQVCEHIAAGGFATDLQRFGLPSSSTIADWQNENEEFAAAYARAREQRGETFAQQIIEIADTEPDAAAARNRIDARKWIAGKLFPRVYGDTQRVDINQQITVADAHASVLMRLADQARANKQQVIETDYKDVTPR